MTIRKEMTIQEDVLRLRIENEALRRIITDLREEIGELKKGRFHYLTKNPDDLPPVNEWVLLWLKGKDFPVRAMREEFYINDNWGWECEFGTLSRNDPDIWAWQSVERPQEEK